MPGGPFVFSPTQRRGRRPTDARDDMADNAESEAERQQRAFEWFAKADVEDSQKLVDAHGDKTKGNRR